MRLPEGDPRTVGAYRLQGRLGAGGMGVVYLVTSRSGRQVAVKVIRPEIAVGEQFRATAHRGTRQPSCNGQIPTAER